MFLSENLYNRLGEIFSVKILFIYMNKNSDNKVHMKTNLNSSRKTLYVIL